jgi:hypothetical protein
LLQIFNQLLGCIEDTCSDPYEAQFASDPFSPNCGGLDPKERCCLTFSEQPRDRQFIAMFGHGLHTVGVYDESSRDCSQEFTHGFNDLEKDSAIQLTSDKDYYRK